MAERLSESTHERVHDSLDIVSRIVELVSLKVKGAAYECRRERRGCSGRHWKVPCVITINTPLGPVKLGVAYAPTLQDVVSLVPAKADLRLDKLFIVTDERVKHDAVRALEEVGVFVTSTEAVLGELGSIDYYDVHVKAYTIKPAVSEDDVKRLAAKYQGWLFKKGEYAGHALVYLPLYTYTARLHRVNYTEAAIEAVEATLSFEAIRGSLVTVGSDGGIELFHSWQRLGDLDYTALEVLELIVREGAASYNDLRYHFEDEKLDAILDVLLDLGLIDEIESGSYIVRPVDLRGYRSVAKVHADRMEEGRPEKENVLPPETPYPLLRSFLSIFGEVTGESVIYYPLYVVIYVKKREGRQAYSYTIIDGMSGERVTDIEDIINSSERSLEVIDRSLSRKESAE